MAARLGAGRWAAGMLGAGIAVIVAGGCAQIIGADWGSYEGGGTTTSTGTQGGCVDPVADCPPTGSECVAAACQAGTCVEVNLPEGTPVVSQAAGGCVEVQCDGNGGTVDAPRQAKTPCTENGGAVCDGAGSCVGCVDGADCPSGACEGAACVGTCGSEDVMPSPPSCASGDSGAGYNCGPSNTSCCDSKLVPCGTYLRSYDGSTYTDDSNPATVSDFRLDMRIPADLATRSARTWPPVPAHLDAVGAQRRSPLGA